MTWDLLVTGARLATMAPGRGIDEPGAVAVREDRIAFAGPEDDLPADQRDAVVRIDAGGRLVTPGLVDCHTHLVFAGNRAGEFEQRLAGASYEDIARRGGGILATVRATRAASDEELLDTAAGRLRHLAASGVTTVEVKSGYGLDLPTELRLLRVARRLVGHAGVRVRTTYLALHAVPPELRDRPDAYVDEVVGTMLPAVAAERLADAVDVFCETVAFTVEQCDRVLGVARQLGLAVKVHADQLTDGGGAALAARHRALSADHLEHASPEGVQALAAAGTVAVLLPGAALVLGETTAPPVAALRAAGVPTAVATDANPGTSPLLSLPLAMHLACLRFGLTPAEALAGATVHAAAALGLAGEAGVLVPGARADLVV
ncbi:MAG: imidazolonepropionase, partial [Acidimicrobiales bacterium]